jgi:hypothetical protein
VTPSTEETLRQARIEAELRRPRTDDEILAREAAVAFFTGVGFMRAHNPRLAAQQALIRAKREAQARAAAAHEAWVNILVERAAQIRDLADNLPSPRSSSPTGRRSRMSST